LQNSEDANLLDIFNGAVTIDKTGTITTISDIKVKGDLNIEGAITITATAGEDLKAKDALFISDSGIVKKADSTFTDRSLVVGIAAKDAKKGEKVIIIIGGKAKGYTGLHAGSKYYLDTNGQITSDAPLDLSHAIPVGVAFSETELIVQVSPITSSTGVSSSN
jgi:hypothetical protein